MDEAIANMLRPSDSRRKIDELKTELESLQNKHATELQSMASAMVARENQLLSELRIRNEALERLASSERFETYLCDDHEAELDTRMEYAKAKREEQPL